MKKDLFELVVLIDESGSMGSVVNDTIGGFNTFLDTHQKLPGEAKLTLVKFQSFGKDITAYNGIDVKLVHPLDSQTYRPGGSTALLDAVGKTIDTVGKRLADTPEEERPEKVIFMIITDGEENDSKEYNKAQIKEKTERQTKEYGWEFIFMGADQDAWSNARQMGVHNSVNFIQKDMKGTLNKMSYYSASARTRSADHSMENFNLSDAEVDKKLADLQKDASKI